MIDLSPENAQMLQSGRKAFSVAQLVRDVRVMIRMQFKLPGGLLTINGSDKIRTTLSICDPL